MIFIILVFVILMWVVVNQFLSRIWFAVCTRKKPGCRNIFCEKAKTCPYSDFNGGI